MKNLFSNRRNIIILIVSIGLIVICSVSLYMFMENQKNEEKISAYKGLISESYNSFEKEEDRAKKLEILKVTIKECNEYSSKKDKFQKVIKDYEAKIDKMKNYFVEDYNDVIVKNTIEKINETNKDVLTQSKQTLENLLNTMESELDVILNTEKLNKYEKDINALIKSYDDRINAIIEEERVAAEAAAEEERQNQVTQQQKQPAKTPSNGNSGGGNSNPYGNGHYDRSWTQDGSTSYSCVHTGEAWDTRGNRWNYWEVLDEIG